IDAGALDAGTTPQVLIQVDLAGEATKFGAPPETVREIAQAALARRAARLRGLMIIPPAVDNPEDARPWFTQLASLRASLAADGVPADALSELSMGMSHDFEVAIDEGATMIRIGTAIFGGRPPVA
ncbi:MAG: alanine racemase, partial [Acidobacteria bacterium]|nr:alanine racemase [Acidobacteriota bacterium]